MSSSLEWAAAISPRHDAIRVGDQNNLYREEVSWPQHEPKHPWAVYLAKEGMYRSLGLDFDRGPGLGPGDDAMDACRLLRSCGFAPVLVDSGGGGYHVFSRLPDLTPAALIHPLVTELRNAWRSLDVTPMVNTKTGSIRPPGSLHRSGGRSREMVGRLQDLLTPPSPDALDRLQNYTQSARAPKKPVKTTKRHRQRPISDRIESLLRHGDTDERFRSRSEGIQAIAWEYVLAGLTEEDLFEALRDPANLGGQKVQAMPPSRARKYVGRSYEKALGFKPTGSRSTHFQREIRAFQRAIKERRWPGLAGATDRTVVDVLVGIARQRRSTTFGISLRQLGELAGIHKGTAARSLRRLRKAGLIELVQKTDGQHAATWRLRRQHADSQIHRGGVS